MHDASWVLPRIIASCYPYSLFPMTRGWAEKQRLGDLPRYAQAEGSDIAQFASFDEEARNLLSGGETAKVRPEQTSRWFATVSRNIMAQVGEAEKRIGDRRSKEFTSTIVDLKILANLALYHSRRIPAAISYSLFRRSADPAALDEAIAREKDAIDAWRQLVAAAGDVYAPDLMMGVRSADLCGHWKDELAAMERGLATLERQRTTAKPVDTHPAAAALKLLAAALANADEPPQIQHQPILTAPPTQPLTITVQARSSSGIKWVRLRYRSVNQYLDYQTLPMQPTGRPDEYQATVPAAQLAHPWDFMYYIEVMDGRGNGRIWPDLEKETPYVVVKVH